MARPKMFINVALLALVCCACFTDVMAAKTAKKVKVIGVLVQGTGGNGIIYIKASGKSEITINGDIYSVGGNGVDSGDIDGSVGRRLLGGGKGKKITVVGVIVQGTGGDGVTLIKAKDFGEVKVEGDVTSIGGNGVDSLDISGSVGGRRLLGGGSKVKKFTVVGVIVQGTGGDGVTVIQAKDFGEVKVEGDVNSIGGNGVDSGDISGSVGRRLLGGGKGKKVTVVGVIVQGTGGDGVTLIKAKDFGEVKVEGDVDSIGGNGVDSLDISGSVSP